MTHSLVWTAIPILAASIATTLIAAADKPEPNLAGWGQPVDPDHDCKIRLEAGMLKIDVPGKEHGLTVETGSMNAPRVLAPISGDFVAGVKVVGSVRHVGRRTSDKFSAYHGAGLLIWQDGQTYLRLERAGLVLPDGRFIHYANFEFRKNGRIVAAKNVEIPDKDTWLRIERRGTRISGLTSADGIVWTPCGPIETDLPKEVKLGVVAVSSSTKPFSASFSDLEVYKRDVNWAAK